MGQLFDSGNLLIWPENSFNQADLTRPLVVLLHGLSGRMEHMTDPFNESVRESVWAYDIDWVAKTIDKGWHLLPPGLEQIFDTFQFLDGLSYSEIKKSPFLEYGPGRESWFSYFKSRSFPVIAYSQSGERAVLDATSPLGAYSQFKEIMRDIDENLLGGENGGVASSRKIAFVGHSRGGIIARRYVLEALSGKLGPIHEEIAASRLRFLGTLNTPHLGTRCGYLPDLVEDALDAATLAAFGPLSAIIRIPIRKLFFDFIDVDDNYLDAVRELGPDSDLIQSINDMDRLVPALDRRFRRVHRASTSGDEPALRRYFTPYLYAPSSYWPNLKRAAKGRKPFRWRKKSAELTFSPVAEEKDYSRWSGWPLHGPRSSIWQILLLSAFVPDEVRAHGGDILVSSDLAIMPSSLATVPHKVISRHHGYPLWDVRYKDFIVGHIPRSYAYPRLSFKLGDNIVELTWNPLSIETFGDTRYRVYRYRDDTEEGFMRSEDLSIPLFYDPVESIVPFSYLVTYRMADGNWAEDDFLEAEPVGSLPVTIRNCRSKDGLLSVNVAASPAGENFIENFIVFSITIKDLLTDSLDHSLTPTGPRMTVATSELARISEPFSLATKKKLLGACIKRSNAAWIEYGWGVIERPVLPTPGTREEEILVEVEVDSSNTVPTEGGTFIDPTMFVFRVMAGIFDEQGAPLLIQEVSSGQCLANKRQMEAPLSSSPPLKPARFVPVKKGYLFAWTAESSSDLYIVKTDNQFVPVGNPVKIEVRPLAVSYPRSQPDPYSLVLHDLFADRSSPGRYVALIEVATKGGLSVQTSRLLVVNFTSKGQNTVSSLEMPWYPSGPAGYKGTIMIGDPPKLYLFISYRPFQSNARAPRYGTIDVQDEHSLDIDSLVWHLFTLPDVPETVDFRVQDILRRCDQEVEVLISATGYFKDRNVSSSLYRICITPSGVAQKEKLHHSGFGPYLVTFTRAAFPSSTNAVFWLTTQDTLFEQALYGQLLLREISDCTTSSIQWNYGSLIVGNIQLDVLFNWVPPREPKEIWIRELCSLLSKKYQKLWYDLVMDLKLRTPTLTLIAELTNVTKRLEEQRKFPKNLRDEKAPWLRVRGRVVLLLDAVDAIGDRSILGKFTKLQKAIRWENPSDRARKFAKYMRAHGIHGLQYRNFLDSNCFQSA